jgi:hypothetical protein
VPWPLCPERGKSDDGDPLPTGIRADGCLVVGSQIAVMEEQAGSGAIGAFCSARQSACRTGFDPVAERVLEPLGSHPPTRRASPGSGHWKSSYPAAAGSAGRLLRDLIASPATQENVCLSCDYLRSMLRP